MEDKHFRTQNRQLAFALILAGCQFAPQQDGGPALNIYTLGKLRQLGVGKGKSIDDAALEACALHKPGHVTYIIQRDETFERAIAAWVKEEKEVEKATKEGREPVPPDVSVEQTMQVLFYSAKGAKAFQELAFINRPLVSTVETSTRTEDGGDHAIVTGRGKFWTAGASRKIKDRLHV